MNIEFNLWISNVSTNWGVIFHVGDHTGISQPAFSVFPEDPQGLDPQGADPKLSTQFSTIYTYNYGPYINLTFETFYHIRMHITTTQLDIYIDNSPTPTISKSKDPHYLHHNQAIYAYPSGTTPCDCVLSNLNITSIDTAYTVPDDQNINVTVLNKEQPIGSGTHLGFVDIGDTMIIEFEFKMLGHVTNLIDQTIFQIGNTQLEKYPYIAAYPQISDAQTDFKFKVEFTNTINTASFDPPASYYLNDMVKLKLEVTQTSYKLWIDDNQIINEAFQFHNKKMNRSIWAARPEGQVANGVLTNIKVQSLFNSWSPTTDPTTDPTKQPTLTPTLSTSFPSPAPTINPVFPNIEFDFISAHEDFNGRDMRIGWLKYANCSEGTGAESQLQYPRRTKTDFMDNINRYAITIKIMTGTDVPWKNDSPNYVVKTE
eukprot:407782_1